MISNRLKIALLFLVILALGLWILIGYYQNTKPKTANDLAAKFTINDEKKDLFLDQSKISKDDLKKLKLFFKDDNLDKAYQYAIYVSKDKVLLVETTPDLVNHQLKIKGVKEITKKQLEDILR